MLSTQKDGAFLFVHLIVFVVVYMGVVVVFVGGVCVCVFMYFIQYDLHA